MMIEMHRESRDLTFSQPFNYDIKDNEKELIRPAINGVKSMLEAASNAPRIQRVVITSSFAAVVDINRKGPFTYTAADWNPLSYEEAADPKSTPVVAYRGSKKYAELAAWDFVKEKKPHFDIVTLCPPMVFGPIVHPINSLDQLNESNAALWQIAQGLSPLPTARVPFWIDVRDLAIAHVEAALRKEAGGKRYTPASPERWSYALAARHMVSGFPELRDTVKLEEQLIDETLTLDGETAAREFGYQYRKFEQTNHVGDHRPRPTEPVRQLLVCHVELFEQLLIRRRLFQRIQLGAVNIFQQCIAKKISKRHRRRFKYLLQVFCNRQRCSSGVL